LTTIYHFIIAAFTQTHDSRHPSYCQYNISSQHECHTNPTTIHAQLQYNMPGKYPQITVHVAQPSQRTHLSSILSSIHRQLYKTWWHSQHGRHIARTSTTRLYTLTSADILRQFGWGECFYTHVLGQMWLPDWLTVRASARNWLCKWWWLPVLYDEYDNELSAQDQIGYRYGRFSHTSSGAK